MATWARTMVAPRRHEGRAEESRGVTSMGLFYQPCGVALAPIRPPNLHGVYAMTMDAGPGADQINLGLLVLRLVFGLFLALHGLNKFFGGGRIPGTARWFASMGFRQPKLQAVAAASTEVAAGVAVAAGLLTPVAAGAVIAVMLVAWVSAHRANGFFIFRKGEGWEYVASIAAAAFAVGVMGPGEWSLDHALEVSYDGWNGAVVAGVLGVGAAALQLAVFYRPPRSAADQ
jgi:putative oxidoreductase